MEIIQQAIDILENEFGEEPNLLYGSLVKRLKESLDERRVNLGGLLGKIMVLRNKSEAEIGPEPPVSANYGRQPNQQPATPAIAGDLEAGDRVFNALLQGIAITVKQRGSDNLQELTTYLKEQSGSFRLPARTSTPFKKWLEMPMDSPRISGDVKDLHKIVNASFVWACNKYGPIDADKILLFGVRSAEQLPESFEHSPRTFL